MLIQPSIWDLDLGCDFSVTLAAIGLRIQVQIVGRVQQLDPSNQGKFLYAF